MANRNGETDLLQKKVNETYIQQTELTKPPWGKLLTLFGVATTIGAAIPVGYNIGVINSPAEFMKKWCNETLHNRYGVELTFDQLQTLWSAVISIFLIGGCLGSVVGAWFADRFGRKTSLLYCGILFSIGAMLFYLCRVCASVEILVAGRLIVGLASGLTTSILPMYLAEVAPLELRGTLAVLTALGVTGGVVVGQVASLQEVFGTASAWHLALSAYLLLVVLCFIPYPIFPESPKYLFIVAGKRDQARRELQRLRGSHDIDRINKELETMEEEAASQTETRTIWSVLTDRTLMMPVILVCVLQGGQQLSGINAVFYYSVSIFENAGLSTKNAKWANLGAGCVNLLTALFTPKIMEYFNRRPIIIGSCFFSGMFLTMLAIVVKYIDAVAWFPIACVLAVFSYIFVYQIGLGPIPYFIGSELFEVAPRPAAMSLGSLASWACNFYVGMTFLPMQSAIGAFVFLPFAIVCLFMAALMYRYLPETRGKQASDVAPLVAHGFNSRRS